MVILALPHHLRHILINPHRYEDWTCEELLT